VALSLRFLRSYLARAEGAVSEPEVDDLRELRELDIVEDDQRAVDGRDGLVFKAE